MRERVDEPEAGRNNLTRSRVPPIMLLPSRMAARPRRLEAQDTALSRLRHGFESRRGQSRENGQVHFRAKIVLSLTRPQCSDREAASRLLRPNMWQFDACLKVALRLSCLKVSDRKAVRFSNKAN